MAGKKEDCTQVERIEAFGGSLDVSVIDGKAFIAICKKSEGQYLELELGSTPYIDDLAGALRRARKRVVKAEQ